MSSFEVISSSGAKKEKTNELQVTNTPAMSKMVEKGQCIILKTTPAMNKADPAKNTALTYLLDLTGSLVLVLTSTQLLRP